MTRTDTERLDWMQRVLHNPQAKPIASIGDLPFYGSWAGVSIGQYTNGVESFIDGPTLRAAIDAAMDADQ